MQLLRDESGTVYSEYLVILVAVALGSVVATVALGVPLYNLYLFQQAVILLPLP